ncbi:MAG: hypothetical protein EOP93_25030, partial [Lysobacteraceae bacterium]
MRPVSLALALALAFATPGLARAADADAPSTESVDLLPPDQDVSGTVIALAGWVVANRDSEG